MKILAGLAAAAVLATLSSVLDSQSAAASGSSPAYAALGDSVAVGVGASDAGSGYVALVSDQIRREVPPGLAPAAPGAYQGNAVTSSNFAVSGETAESMRAPDGQLAAVVELLQERNHNANPVDDVRVVTLTIGGNDAFQGALPYCQGGLTPECQAAVASTLNNFAVDLNAILGELRSAAGADTRIAVMTYYNPLNNPGCVFHPFAGLGDIILEGSPGLLPVGLNDIIRGTAAFHGAAVAETYGLLGAEDLQPDCLHPADSGHTKIAGAFMAVVP